MLRGCWKVELIGSFKNGVLRLSGRGKTHIHVEIQRELEITPPAVVPYLLTNGILIIMNPRIRIPEARNKLVQAFEYLNYFDKR